MRSPILTRRTTLLGLGGAIGFGRASLALAAAATEQRLVVVILRGALDGISAVVPYGDPALAGLRAGLVPAGLGQDNGMLDLGGFYGLHPALGPLHPMYVAGEFLILHAIAGSWRNRSHFEAQDWMEFGAGHRLDSGWLNRVAGQLAGGRKPGPGGSELALAVGAALPVLMRGPQAVANWLPQSFRAPQAELYARIAALHAPDRVTGPAVAAGLRERGFTSATLAGVAEPPEKFGFAALAGAAGSLLAAAEGPRLAALELGGWDTHANQADRLAGPLRQLATGLVALKEGLGAAWGRSAVLVMTEFGRTVRENGTRGTDHGTATISLLLGGRVAGGRVRADWPGLAEGRLFENRDLMPTADLYGLVKGVLGPHLGLTDPALAVVFPEGRSVVAMPRLMRA